ncbi:MAG: hypothetical protein AAGK04_01935, partial [Planctomycetota bacterium]
MSSQNEGSAPRAPGRDRRHWCATLLPIGVAVATLGLLAWTTWPTLLPTRQVRVAQALFDRSVTPVSTSQSAPSGPTVQAAGWLEAEPFYIACTALADGVVATIEVLEGDRVKEGQVVARLVADDAELRLRRADARLAQANAAVELALAERDAAQRGWDEPIALTRGVETGAASLDESRAELARQPSLIAAAEATLIGMEEQFERAERSRVGGAAAELEVILARQRVATQRATIEAIRGREPLLEARVARLDAELRAAQRDLELRIDDRRRLDAARAQLAIASARALESAAARDEAALEADRMTIRAPI